MTPDTITAITAIASILAGASSFGLALALRALAKERRQNIRLTVRLSNALYDVETWKRKASTRTVQMSPAPGGSLGSLGRALRKATAPPSRSFPTARGTRTTDSTDAMMLGFALGSATGPSYDTGNSSSCDTSPSSDSGSSSSSDGGSCGGGE